MTISNIITNSADALPLYILITSLLEGIIFQDNRGLVFFIALCINFAINLLLKHLMWNMAQNAERPKNAPDNCGDKFGNPSGHSQFAWFFATFWIMYIVYSNTFNNQIANVLSIISLILIAIIVSSSRIYIKCHTLSQVLFGGTIGAILAIVAFFTTKKLLFR